MSISKSTNWHRKWSDP